ncbi:MAG: methyl-accepting chemotaxis protein [Turicibacter sp.]|nr:methyl-accepting chemotaxis protein [Turicibacter sp.]
MNTKKRKIGITLKIIMPIITVFLIGNIAIAAALITLSQGQILDTAESTLSGNLISASVIMDIWYSNVTALMDGVTRNEYLADAIFYGDMETVYTILHSLFISSPVVDGVQLVANITYINMDGLFAQSGNFNQSVGLNVLDTPHAHTLEATRAGLSTVSESAVPSPVTGALQFWFTQPVVRNGDVLGFIAFPANVAYIEQYLIRTVSENQHLTIMDSSGMVIATTDTYDVGINITEIGYHISTMFPPGSIITTIDYTGQDVMAMLDYLPLFDLYSLSVAPNSLNMILQYYVAAAAILLLVIAAAFVTSLYIGKVVIMPIKRLVKAGTAISHGEMNVNIPQMANDEIGELSDSFRNIQKSLNKLITDVNNLIFESVHGHLDVRADTTGLENEFKDLLESTNAIVNTMFEYLFHIPTPTVIIDPEGRIKFMNKTVLSYGYSEKDIGKKVDELFGESVREYYTVFEKIKKGSPLETMRTYVESPKGLAVEDHTIWPISFHGELIGFMNITFDVTSTINNQRINDKIISYQANEGKAIRDALLDFGDGILKFDYTPVESDNDTEVSYNNFNAIGTTLTTSVSTIKSYVSDVQRVLEEIADKNLDIHTNLEYHGDFVAIQDSINSLVKSVSALILEIQEVSANVESVAGDIAQSSTNLTASFTSQVETMREMTESMQHISEKTTENAQNANTALEVSQSVLDVARDGDSNMQKLTDAMSRIKVSSNDISKIVKIIEDIAFQTNLLALNAAVEAARAGEHGRGFAVVAEEVRSLANRSSLAAKDASVMLESTLTHVDDGVNMADLTSASLEKIVAATDKSGVALRGISETTHEQVAEITNVTENMQNVYNMTSSNTDTASNNTASSEELAGLAMNLRKLVMQFRVKS